MAKLLPRFEVKVTAEYHYESEDFDTEGNLTRETVENDASIAFYDNVNNAEIYSTEITKSWFECEDCGEDDVEEDHECENEAE